jgi:hypothetical protein
MKEVILHIGIHKTGSTTIQEALSHLSDTNTRVASFVEKNHSIPIATIFSKQKFKSRAYIKRGISPAEVLKKKAHYLSLLSKDIEDDSYERLILSGEAMSTLSFDEQQSCVKYFHERGCKVKVIALVREPLDWIRSATQQKAKGGAEAFVKTTPKYRTKLEGYLNCVGQEHMQVYDFNKLITDKGLINSMSDILEVTLNQVPHQNTSMSKEALTLLYEFNNIESQTMGSVKKLSTRNYLISEIRDFFSIDNGFTNLKQLDFRGLIGDGLDADIEWLRLNFSIDYSSDNEQITEGFPYIKATECIRENDLIAFFDSLKVNYKNNSPLRTNLDSMYAELYARVQ